MKRDPFTKLYHMADKMTADGRVSALCFARPRAIDLRRASWTIVPTQVNCSACLKVMAAQGIEVVP